MNIHRVTANPKVQADEGKVAIERGPVVYCLEGDDNGSKLENMIIPDNAGLTATFKPDILGGVTVISGEAVKFEPAEDGMQIKSEKLTFKAIPYFVWINRGTTEMKVWFPRKVEDVILSKEEIVSND